MADYEQPNQVWLNDGLGNFADSGQNFISTESSAVDIGDRYDDGDIDATTVDGTTMHFGPNEAAPARYALEDIDQDGDLDMILHFKTQDTGIAGEETEAVLFGGTVGGRKIKGVDFSKTVGCKKTQ